MKDKGFPKWYLKRILDKVYLILEALWLTILTYALLMDFKVFCIMFLITMIFITCVAGLELIQIIMEKYKKWSNKN